MRVQPDGWLSLARTHTARRDSTGACSLNTSVKHARHTVHNRGVAEWPRCDESVNRPRTQRHTSVDRHTVTRHGRVITGRDGCGFHADTARLQPATSKASAVSHTHPTRTHIATTCARGPPLPRHTSRAGGPGSRAAGNGGRQPPTRCRLRRTYPGQARRPAKVHPRG